MENSSRTKLSCEYKVHIMSRLLIFVIMFTLTKCRFVEHPLDGSHLEFFPLTLRWVHTFQNIRGCTWLFSHSKLSANEIIIMYGSKEGLETKHPGWQLSDVKNPCSGGIQKKMSVLADAGFYELRIVSDGNTFISESVGIGIIRQTERSIQVMSNGETPTYELLPGRDFNRTLEIKDATKVAIKLNENYPEQACTKIQTFSRENQISKKDVCNRTFINLEFDFNITHVKLFVNMDVVQFSPLTMTLVKKQSNDNRQNLTFLRPESNETWLISTSMTPEIASSKSRQKKVLTIIFVLVGVLVLSLIGVFTYIKLKKKPCDKSLVTEGGSRSHRKEHKKLLKKQTHTDTQNISDDKNIEKHSQLSECTNIFKQDKPSTTPNTERHNVPDYTTLRFKKLVGSKGSKDDQFNEPQSVTCTLGNIIIVDSNNHRVKCIDNNLDFEVGRNMFRHGELCCPAGIVAGQEEVFVSDYQNDRIVVFTTQGDYLREFGTRGTHDDQLMGPQGIDISDGHLYIADSANHRVKVVQFDGTFVRQIGSKGSKLGQFKNKPVLVAVMDRGDGHVLVNEINKCQLHIYTRTGEYLGLFPPSVPTNLAASNPYGITVDTYDNVLITYTTGQLVVYDHTGELITITGSRGSDPGQFKRPAGVAVNTTERFVIVCDSSNNRLQQFEFDYICEGP